MRTTIRTSTNSSRIIVTNSNMHQLVNEHPEIIEILSDKYGGYLAFGIVILPVGLLFLFLIPIIGIIVICISLFSFYRAYKFHLAYEDAISSYYDDYSHFKVQNISREPKHHIKKERIMSLSDFFKAKQFKLRISELEQKTKELELQVECLNKFISDRYPLFDLEPVLNNYEKSDFQHTWNYYWRNINHDSYWQLSHQKRACSAAMTPLSINKISGSGTFKGEDEVYKTTLISCQCMNFQKYIKPCKHMYRLAHELGVYELYQPVKSVADPINLMSKSEIERKKRYLSKDSLELLYRLMNQDELIVSHKEADQLLRLNLAIINPNKYSILNTFNKQELISMLPTGTNGIKYAKKSILIEKIISQYPEVISEIEKKNICIILSPYASRI